MPMKLRALPFALALAGLLSAPVAAFAQSDTPAEMLLRGAQKWVAKDRSDLAENLLKKLILIEPTSQEALFMLGNIELKKGQPDEALRYLHSLKQVAPDSPRTKELGDLHRMATTGKATLEKARSLAQSGKTAEAEKMLNQLFNGKPPKGDLAIEYYRITGASKTGYNQAQKELASLYKETGDTRYRLVELELQANHPEYLTSAIRGYEELSGRQDVNPRTLQENWRIGLYKHPDNNDKQNAIQHFLAAYPGDKEMRELLGDVKKNIAGQALFAKSPSIVATVSPSLSPTLSLSPKAAVKPAREKKPLKKKQPDESAAQNPEEAPPLVLNPDIVARTEALDALDDGKVELAETSLTDLLKRRPEDVEVLGGLGIVKLKQGKHAEAEKWFTLALQAAQAAKSETGKWKSLVATAGFWKNIRAAEELLKDRKLPEAEAAARQALAMKPAHPEALVLLGNIKAAGNSPAEAEQYFRDALKAEGHNTAAMIGLVSVLVQEQRSEEALAHIQQVLQKYPAEWNKNPGGMARLLREEANLHIAARHHGQALKALEKGVLVAPRNPWLRFSLAKLYVSLNLPPLAKRVLQEGAELAPKDPEMHYVFALVLLSMDDYAGGLDSLAQIPEKDLTPPMREARDRALIQYYIQQADNKLAHEDRKEAIRIMSIAETQAGTNIPAVEQVAEGWFKLGLHKQGLALMRKLPPPVPLDTQVYYASLLNRAKKDPELIEYLPSLRIPGGSDETAKKYRERIRDIEFSMANRQFDRLMNEGKKDQAQQLADAVLNASQLSNADYFKMHRTYFSRAELPENAITQLNQEKEQNPNDLNIRWELAYAYYQEKQNRNAQRELQELLPLTPSDDIDRRLRIAQLRQSMQDATGSRQIIDDLTRRYPNNTEVLLQAGNLARSEGHYNEAMSHYKKAKKLAQQTTPANAASKIAVQKPNTPPDITLNLLPAPAQAHSGTEKQAGLVQPLLSTPESARLYRTVIASDVEPVKYTGKNAAALAEQEMADIASIHSGKIEVGLDIQSKQATDGTSTYNATEIPVLAKFPVGYEGLGSVQIDKLDIDVGALPSTFADAARFGKIKAYNFVPAQPLVTKSSGVSVALGYEQDSVKADVGVVGIGFPVKNLVGGLRMGGDAGRMSYSLSLSRRPITGSQVSYAGARDPVSGEVWGGVTNTGLSLYLSTIVGSFNASTFASYGLLRGKNVLNNTRLYLRAAIDRDIYTDNDMALNVGLNTNYMNYANNQSFYTFGHGGYYSPQSSLNLSLPITLSGRYDLLSYQIRTNVTYSRTREDTVAYYPGDADLQALAGGAMYTGGPGGGDGYGLRAMAEYRIAPNFVIGGQFNMDRSAYFAPNSLLFYLRYLFKPETGPVRLNPDPVTPYSQY